MRGRGSRGRGSRGRGSTPRSIIDLDNDEVRSIDMDTGDIEKEQPGKLILTSDEEDITETSIRQRANPTEFKRKHDDENGDDDGRRKRPLQEIRENWMQSDDSDFYDSESDLEELNVGLWDYSDVEKENGEGLVEPDTQDQDQGDDRLGDHLGEADTQDQDQGDHYQPGRIRLKNRLVNSLEACLEQNNYDR